MAGKNINIVSKTLAESYIRKQIKALKQDPAQTIHTLTKQLLEKPDSPLEKYLLHITPEKLQDTQSGYYQLFHDILPKINTEHLVTLAMNIGYNSLFTASKNTQLHSPESIFNALWAFLGCQLMESITKKMQHNIKHRLLAQKRTEPAASCFLSKKMHGNYFHS